VSNNDFLYDFYYNNYFYKKSNEKHEQVGLDSGRYYFKYVRLSFANKFKVNYIYIYISNLAFKTMLLVKMHILYYLNIMTL